MPPGPGGAFKPRAGLGASTDNAPLLRWSHAEKRLTDLLGAGRGRRLSWSGALHQSEEWTILDVVSGTEQFGQRVRAALALILTSGVVLAAGCSDSGTGGPTCLDGLFVALDWEQEIPGAYVLTVEADGSSYACDLGLLWDPGAGGANGARVAPSTGGALGAAGAAGAAGRGTSAAGAAGLEVVDGRAPADSCSFSVPPSGWIYMRQQFIELAGEHPSPVVVTLTRDGATVVDVTLEPEYEVCGSNVPRNRSAREVIAVP